MLKNINKMPMSHFKINFILFLILSSLIFSSVLHAEFFQIEKYNVNVNIGKDSSAVFNETILVKFFEPRHGIFRFIPYKFFKKKFHIKILKIEKSFNGINFVKEKYLIKKRGDYIFIRIGKRSRRYQGLIYYRIVYNVFDAVRNNEFVWNVIGFKWPVTIKNISVNIKFPEISNINNVKFYTYAKIPVNYNIKNNEINLISKENLAPYNGITVKLKFPIHFIKPVPLLKRIWWFFCDYSGFFLPVITFLIMFFIWKKYGKDEKKGVIVITYNPPKNLTPAEVGTLIDDKVDLKDLTATILDLGAKGYIKIEKLDNKIYFKKLKDIDNNLKEHEKIILRDMFSENSNQVTIDQLKNQFYITVAAFKEIMYNYIADKSHLYTVNPEYIRHFFHSIGYGFIISGICWIFLSLRIDVGIGLIISGLIILLFSKIMPKKTHKGALLYRKILGFKEFIEKVDKDKLKRFAEKDPEIFGRLLPYAIALGIEKKWAEKFEGIEVSPPSYYYFPSGMDTFSTILFFNLLTNDLNTMNEVFIPDNSSSGFSFEDSGINSGFGGGGIGGGFGGGGGGSW